MTEVLAIPGMDALRRRTLGDGRICIAILDGPVALDHPCFQGADLTVLDGVWSDKSVGEGAAEHACHIASVILGQPGTSVEGVAPRCRGLSIPVLWNVETAVDPISLANAIGAAFREGADIIHIAACIPSMSGQPDDMLARAIQTCLDNNVLIVAPGGNDRGECWCFPAAIPGVLAVGASNNDGDMARFSNWGGVYQEQGIVAPGFDILGAAPDGGTVLQKGTSCAAPIVTGVAGLLMSLQLQQGWTLDATQVRQALLTTATPSDAAEPEERERALAGFLNIEGAVRELFALNAGKGRAVEPSMAVAPGPVFCLGQIGYDFGTQGRRDRFRVRLANPDDPRQMAAYLEQAPSEAAALIWTLNLDGGPLYGLLPEGPFAGRVYEALAAGLMAEGVAVPGVLTGGAAQLLSGQSLAVLRLGDPGRMTALDRVDPVLDRLYRDCRNPGVSPADRALNAVAADAPVLAGVLARAGARVLDGVSAAPRAGGRPGAWEVKLGFVDPDNTRRPAVIYGFDLDLAENPPVLRGPAPGYVADGA
ncbi:hypothetical protein QO010_000237 [Caulobacter ginsengisoli]|uniref:Peptidase S8/S53 domain-containing protein n=1 Tax=Caulobacter ginsengisoli TaxID=400775 RepID=A0ABU0IKF5_9CAUL|nr:S8 family serine peptidase [Caulobacter ginsengisoli]MDQ0462489.1 hypothetical protein [Caulobacter ginsengisoli]